MSTFVSCRECGEVINCPNCSIPLAYHINDGKHVLNCHHCDYKAHVPTCCPNCSSTKIKFFGAGIDKIEKELILLFPKARIQKVDSKTMSNKNDYVNLYQKIKEQKIDILIGTQILAKGLDIPTVDLVGIVSADTGLHLPYFKANEKIFSLLTQISGRSGRKENTGETIIQSYWPESKAIRLAAAHDYLEFYKNEIKEREKFLYPPFVHLVRVVSEDSNQKRAREKIESVAANLRESKLSFIGPAPCFFTRINNRFRFHLIIKVKNLPNKEIDKIFHQNPYLVWDTDPVDLL